MKSSILLVEDELDIQDLILLHLKREGYQVEAVTDGEEAVKRLRSKSYDLLVLDWMLPGMSGLDITQAVRQRTLSAQGGMSVSHKVPILMVTARMETVDIVRGLEAGCDDYVTKPFEIPVFLARVRALLRRHAEVEIPAPESVIRLGDLFINAESYEVSCQGQPLSLTASEFKLLLALAQNRGRVLTRDRLIDCVQGVGVSVVDRAIDTHVFGLRKKLGPCSDVIETIRGVGYRVRGEVVGSV